MDNASHGRAPEAPIRADDLRLFFLVLYREVDGLSARAGPPEENATVVVAGDAPTLLPAINVGAMPPPVHAGLADALRRDVEVYRNAMGTVWPLLELALTHLEEQQTCARTCQACRAELLQRAFPAMSAVLDAPSHPGTMQPA